MRAAIYSPYLDTFGGGEKYMMAIAEIIAKNNFKVDVLLDNHLRDFGTAYLKETLSKRFNLSLTDVNFIQGPLGKGSNFFTRTSFLKKYDILFYLTDGSIFYPTAKMNILHIQSPLVGQPSKNLLGKLKLKGWNLIVYNSNFTRESAKENWPIKSEVIYPPCDIKKIKPLEKKRYILSVGRFFGYLKEKKHELMIDVFKNLYQSGKIKEWTLILAGSAGKGDKEYLTQLKEKAKELPVNFYPNLSYDDLIKLYGQSSIYWHASGFGEEDPTKMEHFGITTVEAMAGGAVPIVIKKGGQIEIVEHGISGFLWESLEDLNKYTMQIIEDDNLKKKMSKQAIERSKNFSKERFEQSILKLCKIK